MVHSFCSFFSSFFWYRTQCHEITTCFRRGGIQNSSNWMAGKVSMRNACWPETLSDALCGFCELLATASCSAFAPNCEKPDKKDLQILVNLSLFPFSHVMNPFSEVRARPESDERRRIRALSHRTAPPRPRHTDRTPRRTRNIAFARSRRFCTRLIPGGSGNVASKNRPEEGSGEVGCRQHRARSCPARRKTRPRWTPGASARTCGTSATRSGWMNSSPTSRTATG